MSPAARIHSFVPRVTPFVCEFCRARLRSSSRRFLSAASRHGHGWGTSHQNKADTIRHASSLSEVILRTPSKSKHKYLDKRNPKLPNGPARTRFAPSPTGYLHIGGLRTALFSYLLAKRTGGQFLLRIEDTDQKRLVPDAEENIYRDLRWAGLEWDEGPDVAGPHGPYRQSERNHIYQQHARRLLDQGSAYRCFCPPQTSGGDQQSEFVTSECYSNCSAIELAESQQRADSGKEPFTVRLHSTPDDSKRTYPDLVYGTIKRLKRSPAGGQLNASPEDGDQGDIGGADTILLKSDGTPTYHFANVVDDHLMEITHVIRGTEWMASTPLHYDIYDAFGWKPPEFAHVGLLVDEDQAKLSKRSKNQNLALHVSTMREMFSVLPYTLNNFLALLGWSNPLTSDTMDMDMLTSNFDLKFTRGNAMVTMQKLWFLQSKQVDARCTFAEEANDLNGVVEIVDAVVKEVRKATYEPLCNGITTLEEHPHTVKDRLSAYCADILLADRKNYTNPAQFVQRNDYFFSGSEASLGEVAETFHAGGNKATLYALQSHANSLVESFDWSSGGDGGHRAVTGTGSAINDLERRLGSHMVVRKWHAVLTGFPLVERDTAVDDRLESYGIPMASEDALGLLAQTQPMTVADIAAKIHGRSNRADEGKAKAEEEGLSDMLDWRAKAVNAMANKYLRHRLAYGRPGPSIAAIMAVLGEDECRRRLC